MVKVISFLMSLTISFCSLFGMQINPIAFKLNADKLDKKISTSQEKRIDNGLNTGAHIIVNQAGETILNKTYGKEGANGEALKSDAMYRIASMTKPITAVALLIEYDRGNIDIYADVADYLPQFKDMQVKVLDKHDNVTGSVKAKNPIKVYQLVSHTSGVGDVPYAGENSDAFTVQSAMEYLAAQPLDFEPGTQQHYSTGAFDVAAAIIENTSGLEFSEYLKINIFDKLGMKDTTFEPTEEQWSRFVKMHGAAKNEATGKYDAFDSPVAEGCVFVAFPTTYHAAGGGLASTAEDYLKFAQMLLNKGKAEDGTVVVSEKSVELMMTPVIDKKIMSGNQRWGLGVRVITSNLDTLPKGSFGWSGAYGSHFWIDPTNKIVAIYMKNSAFDGGSGSDTGKEFEKDVMKSLSLKRFK